MTEKKKQYLKTYRSENRKKFVEYQRKYLFRKRGGIPPVKRGPTRSLEEKRQISKDRARRIRLNILNHYGNGNPHCVCCGESYYQFLALDHKNGGGSKHRKEVGDGTSMYSWIIRNNYPEIFQILCHNCNSAKGFYGECPHKKEIK